MACPPGESCGGIRDQVPAEDEARRPCLAPVAFEGASSCESRARASNAGEFRWIGAAGGVRYGSRRMTLPFAKIGVLGLVFGSVACSAVYPEVQTPLRTPPPGFSLAPAQRRCKRLFQ